MPVKIVIEQQAPPAPYFRKGRRYGSFAPLPASIMKSPLSDAAKLTWARLAQFTNKADFAFPLVATLATELGHSRSKVERSIRELKKVGLLEAVSRPGHSNLYRLRLPVEPAKPAKIPSGMKGLILSPVTYIKDNSLKISSAGATLIVCPQIASAIYRQMLCAAASPTILVKPQPRGWWKTFAPPHQMRSR